MRRTLAIVGLVILVKIRLRTGDTPASAPDCGVRLLRRQRPRRRVRPRRLHRPAARDDGAARLEVLNQSRGGDNTKTLMTRFAPEGAPDPKTRYLMTVNPSYVVIGLSFGNENLRVENKG